MKLVNRAVRESLINLGYPEAAVDAERRGRVHREVEVGCPLVDHRRQQSAQESCRKPQSSAQTDPGNSDEAPTSVEP